MKALVKRNAGPGLELLDVPEPEPGSGEVLIRVARTGICGTDLHIRSWDASAQSMVTPPVVVGHEIAGHVEAIGPGVDSINVGDLVSVEGHIVCGGVATVALDVDSCARTPKVWAFTATVASPSSS